MIKVEREQKEGKEDKDFFFKQQPNKKKAGGKFVGKYLSSKVIQKVWRAIVDGELKILQIFRIFFSLLQDKEERRQHILDRIGSKSF